MRCGLLLQALFLISAVGRAPAADVASEQEQLAQIFQGLDKGRWLTVQDEPLIRKHIDQALPILLDALAKPKVRDSVSSFLTNLMNTTNNGLAVNQKSLMKKRALVLAAGSDAGTATAAMRVLEHFPNDPEVDAALRQQILHNATEYGRLNALRSFKMLAWTNQTKSEDEKEFLLRLTKDSLLPLAQESAEVLKTKYGISEPLKDVLAARAKPLGGIKPAIEVVNRGSAFESAKAYQELEFEGEAAIPAMLQAIQHNPNPAIRQETYYSIQRILRTKKDRNPKTLASILAALHSPEMRRYSVDLLGEYLTFDKARLEMISIAKSDPDPAIRGTAINWMSASWANEQLPLLRQFLLDKHPYVRSYAGIVLARHGDSTGYPQAVATLKSAVIGGDPNDGAEKRYQNGIFRFAISVIGKVGSTKDLALLATFIKSPIGHELEGVAIEARQDIELREAGDANKQREYLFQIFDKTGSRWANNHIKLLLPEREYAQYLFKVVQTPSANDSARTEAKTYLFGRGWIDRKDYWKKPSEIKLLDSPQPNSP